MAEDEFDDGPISLDDGDDDAEPIELDDASDEDEPIKLVEEDEDAEPTDFGAGVKTFGVDADAAHKREYKRSLNTDGSGATRCRIFHSKIAQAPLENMESQINDWLDGDEIEVKQVGHIIGTMEGKRPEPNLMVIVWY